MSTNKPRRTVVICAVAVVAIASLAVVAYRANVGGAHNPAADWIQEICTDVHTNGDFEVIGRENVYEVVGTHKLSSIEKLEAAAIVPIDRDEYCMLSGQDRPPAGRFLYLLRCVSDKNGLLLSNHGIVIFGESACVPLFPSSRNGLVKSPCVIATRGAVKIACVSTLHY